MLELEKCDTEKTDEALYWGSYQIQIIKKYSLCNLVRIVLIDTSRQLVVDRNAILPYKENSVMLVRR